MRPFTFEMTSSKRTPLRPKLIRVIIQTHLYLFLLLMTWSCQQREFTIDFVQSDHQVQVLSKDYEVVLDANALTVELPTGETSQLVFEAPMASAAEAVGENEYLFSAENYDFRLYSKDGQQAAYDLLLPPNSDPDEIRFRLAKADEAIIDIEGNLLIPVENGHIKHSKPISFQEINGTKKEVTSQFVLEDDFLGFKLGSYDPNYTVVIDPELSFVGNTGDFFNTNISLRGGPNKTAGENIIYDISYASGSSDGNFDNAQIIVSFPVPFSAIGIVSFPGNADVVSSMLTADPNDPNATLFVIDLVDPFNAGSTRLLDLTIQIREGALCNGTPIVATVMPEVDDDNVELGEDSAEVIIEDDTPPFPIDLSGNEPYIIDNPVTLEVDVLSNNSFISELTDATLTVEIPADVVVQSCDGCAEGLPLTGPATLTWEYPSIDNNNLPTVDFDVEFPSPTFSVDNMVEFLATLVGTGNECESIVIQVEDDLEISLQEPPPPSPELVCVNPSASATEIGSTGTLSFSFKNNGFMAPVETFTYAFDVPNAMGIQNLPDISFVDNDGSTTNETGIPARVVYETTAGGSPITHAFSTNTSSSEVSLGGSEYFTRISYIFDAEVPVGFMPVGNNISVSYEVLTTGLDGSTIEGANPRIPNSSPCNGNGDFDYLTIAPSLTADFLGEEGTADDQLGITSNNCRLNRRVTDPEEGPQTVGKSIIGKSRFFPEDEVEFRLTFDHCGETPLINVALLDVLPAGLTINGTESDAFTYSSNLEAILNGELPTFTMVNNTLEIDWDITDPFPAPGAGECDVYTITYTATVDMNLQGGANPKNCFSLDGELNGVALDDCTATSHGSTLRDCIRVKIRNVGPGDLKKTAVDLTAPTSKYFPEDEIEYTIDWTIESGFDSYQLVVTDILPAGIKFEGLNDEAFNETLDDLLADSDYDASDVTFTVSPSENDPNAPTTLTWTFPNDLIFPGDPTPDSFEGNDRYTITYRTSIIEGTVGQKENCFTADAMMGPNVRATPAEACLTIDIAPVGPISPNKTFSGSRFFPTTETEYTLNFSNSGPFDVVNMTIVDVLPAELELVPGSVMYTQLPVPPGNPGPNDPTFEVSEMNGQEVLTWFFPILDGAPDGEETSPDYIITYRARIKPGIPKDTRISNCFEIDVTDEGNPNIASRRDGTTSFIVENCSNDIVIRQLAAVDSRKGVRGDCDEDFKFFDPDNNDPIDLETNPNGVGLTFPGGSADYRLEICNIGNVVIEDFVLIDILPWVGDLGVTVLGSRESEWRPNFSGVPVLNTDLTTSGIDLSDFTIEYSIEQAPCRNGILNPDGSNFAVSPCNGPLWTTTLPADIANVQAIRIKSNNGVSIPIGAKLVIEWPMFAPVDAPVFPNLNDNLIAWNSFAYQAVRMDNGVRFPYAEPNKVGIALKQDTRASIGDYVWVDRNEDNTQNEPHIDGVNGVTVTLFKTEDMIKGNGDDTEVASTVTGFDFLGNPGYYLFPDLELGKYYIVFDLNTIPETTQPVTPDAGIDDADDSDADVVMGMTEIEELTADENNRDYDLGITPPNCDLTGTNVDKLCLAGEASDPDDDQVQLLSFNVTKDKVDTRQGEVEAGGSTYTVVVESCTTEEVNGMSVTSTTQLYIQTGLSYGVTYAVNPEAGETQIPGLTTALAATFDAPEGTDIKISFLDDQNPLCYEIEVLSGCRDYGDLPDTYGTTGEEGAWHSIVDGKQLGRCLDSDPDGNPDAMANGDDNSAGTRAYGECEDQVNGGDDEDGIEFLTPIIPGQEACIKITYSLPADTPGFINAWIDYDGSEDFTAVDQVQFVGLTDDGVENTFTATNNLALPVDNNAAIVNKEVIACFMVPDLPNVDEFKDGNLFARFRLSCAGDLGPTGGAADGEVEDYFRPLGKVGNLVFQDYNFNGIQDMGEPGINDAEVTLIWAGLDDTNIGDDNDQEYTLTTGLDAGFDQGEYYFCGLLPGTYKLKYTSPDGMTPTRSNEGEEDVDSDGLIPDDMDLSMVMGTPFVIEDVTALPTDEDGSGDDSTDPTGSFANNQVDETHDQGFAALDYGDLPEHGTNVNFATTMAEGGPVHTIIPDLYLGAGVDGERDGQPRPGADGDGLDEDGVVFLTPLVPGNKTCIEVTASIPDDSEAYLQAWIDWNDNGVFDIATETIDFDELTDGLLEESITNEIFCFDVPANAIFNGGAIYVRFRLSPEGGLDPNGPDKYDSGGTVPAGEVEDYVQTTAKVGNLVFEDLDFDGIQDAGEPGINGVTVSLIWFGEDGVEDDPNALNGDDVLFNTLVTGTGGFDQGEYYFCGLTDGNYKLIFQTPENMTPTRTDIGDQTSGGDLDSDGQRTGMDLSMVMETFEVKLEDIPIDEDGLGDNGDTRTGTFPNNQTDETHDQGFASLDYGDLPETGNGDAFSTEMANGGATHVIIPGLSLGTIVDAERDGAPSTVAAGDDNTGNLDDEDGIQFNTPLIPGNQACVQVTAINTTGNNAVLEAWIDWDNSGTLEEGEKLSFTNNGAVNSSITNQDFCFMVPSTATFNDGMIFARFRLSPSDANGSIGVTGPNGPDKYNNAQVVPQGEVEDYKLNVGKIGNLVFEDYNFNGIQEANEPGINNVTVTLTWGGPDNDLTTTSDNVNYSYVTGDDNALDAGAYYFCGIIGNDPLSGNEDQNYKLTYQSPTLPDGSVYTVTRDDEGNDEEVDSDGTVDMSDLTMAMEEFTIGDVTDLPTEENSPLADNGGDGLGTFPDNQVDETYDQGFARLDYGDLPDDPADDDDFPTLMEELGAVHTIFPGLSLGANVDSELDGTPDADAGLEDGGDDFFGEHDDEDGIDFNTPLVPGNAACVEVTVSVPAGLGGAVLQAWIDWNGNNELNSNEALNLAAADTDNFFTNGALSLNEGANQVLNVCFDVPADAVFNEGMVFARFRLSNNGNLTPGGPEKYPSNAASAVVLPLGEVEDYKLNVAKIGNLVWEDFTGDGLQDPVEPGINGVTVQLTWAGLDGNLEDEADNVVYEVTTGANSPALGQLADGQYYFCGLIGGEDYKITVLTPEDMSPGLTNQGDDAFELDNDGIVMNNDLSMVMSETISLPEDVRTLVENEVGVTDAGNDGVGTYPDNQVDERYDFAFNGVDYGDLPNTFITLDASNGPKHIIQPLKYLGSCIDAERDATTDPLAGLFEGGDDGTLGDYTRGTCDTPGDDEDGIELPTPLIPGYEACIDVTYTAEALNGFLTRDDVFLSAWVDFDGDNAFTPNERIEFTAQDGAPITPSFNVPLEKGTDVTTSLCFIVDPNAIYQNDLIRLRFRMNCETNPDDVTPTGLLVGGEVEDYDPPIAKVGNYNWFDNDLNGDQAFLDAPNTGVHADETGINDVPLVLLWYGEDGIPNTDDDRTYIKSSATGFGGEGVDGIYYFCGLQEGTFEIIPLKYASPDNLFSDILIDEFGVEYDITDPETMVIDGVSTPRSAITPERKILTRPNDIADDDNDSDGAPNLMFEVPDLVMMGFTTLNESGVGDIPTVFGFPDTLTNLTLDFGWVQEPNIEVLQRIVGVDYPESGECDHFNVMVDVCMVNTAGAEMDYAMGVPLKNLQLMGDLSTQLGATFVDVVSTQLIGAGLDNNGVRADISELEYAPTLTPQAPQQYPTLNPDYNGGSDKNLFLNNTGYIWPGEKVMVRYVFEVAPEEVDMMQGINLEWNLMGSGKATNYVMEAIPDFFDNGNQYMAMDVSNDYTGPTPAEFPVDGTYDDPDEPTTLGDGWKRSSELAARDQVNFSADADCKVILEEENLIQPYYPELDEGVYPLGGYYRFMIEGTPGIFFEPTEAMAASIVNGNILFQVLTVNKACEPRWGELLLEDKTGPVVEAPDEVAVECWLIDDVLNQASTIAGGLSVTLPNDDGHLGSPVITDACNGNIITDYTFSDAIEYFNCSEETVMKNGEVVGTLTARITRRFVTKDSKGNTAEATQTINFFQPPLTAFEFVADADNDFEFVDGKWVQTIDDCNADSSNPPAVVYPEYTDCFGNTVDLGDNLCNLSSTVKGRLFDNICGDGYKMERTIEILDWCAGGVVAPTYTYLLKVGDFSAPEFDGCADDLDANTYTIADVSTIIDALNADSDDFDVPAPGEACAMVSTGPMNCTASINTNLSALRSRFGNDIIQDACDEDLTISVEILSYLPVFAGKVEIGDPEWQSGGYVMQGSMATGLPIGRHALVISASDGCYNTALGILFFEVMDQVKPVMKCDDELRVTLVEGDEKLGIQGYALATYQDVDEGSWDNCELVDLHVRRDITNADARVDWEAKNGDLADDADYTPWADIVEFFCADVGEPVTVELRGTDAKGNQSVCWLDVDVENGTNYSLALEAIGSGMITCEEDFDVTKHARIVAGGLGCAALDFDFNIVADLDQCGEGTYTITIDDSTILDSKNAPIITGDPVVVQVKAVHDYWIKFPADVELTCDDLEEYEGVTTSAIEDNACDLLAVYTETPERFVASGGACYKLFQTYKVINWCEYDGESLPVIVSRDWDAHNGYDGCFVNDDDDQTDPGEYNLNPQEPDGDGVPGDEDIYVIVEVNDLTGTGTVYYDNDSDPTNTSTANLFGDDSTNPSTSADDYEGYWWAVTRTDDCRGTDSSVWYDDEDNRDGSTGPGFDIDGNDAQDDDDNRYGSHGYWQYTQHILVYDETAPTVTVTADVDCSQNNELCTGGAELTIVVEDDCTPVENIIIQIWKGDLLVDNVTATSNGDGTATATWSDDGLSLGSQSYAVRVNDGCGNVTEAPITVEIKDCKAPAPICHDGLQVELMPTEDGGGMAAVWASDFVASDIGDCTGQGPEEVTLDGTSSNTAPKIATEAYSIYRDAGFTDTTYVSPATDETVRGLIVTCDDLAANGGMVMVRVYAEDMAGNADYCLTFVQIQDNNGACGTAAVGEIAGLISTENVETVEGVEIQLSGAQSNLYMTGVDGTYGFGTLQAGGDYSILPHKDVDHSNGVSTFDLILIQKHILGSQTLDSPYKLIAADVNNSKSVSTLDLIQLRKLILNIDTEFANNTSWRFVDADYKFADTSNPWLEGFPEVHNVNNLEGTVLASFVAVKIGDVNESALANTAQSVEPRSIKDVLELQTEDLDMRRGNVYTVSFSADLNTVAGYQFTMELNPAQVEILDLKEGIAKSENFGVFTEEGLITSSYHRKDGEEIQGKVLFSVTIRARKDASLSEVLGLSSRYTAAEAYSLSNEDLALGLVIGNQEQTDDFALYQNTPNPFKAETMISFKLPALMTGILEFKDISGRTILIKEGDFTKGYNEVRLDAEELPSAGVYFYTLHAGQYTATKKLIMIKQ